MANNVFANGRELSCKSGSGKSICAFPDVCFTPPENPATPPGVPIPYPNTGFTSDTTSGSKTVKISGKEVMLKNKSHFKKSVGDEAGCAAKKGVLTSVNRGKVYFNSWSMDVKIEGKNAVRHLDLTTHNHNPAVGNSPPWPFIDEMAPHLLKCLCASDQKKAKEKCKDFDPPEKACPPDKSGPLKSKGPKVDAYTTKVMDGKAGECLNALRCRLGVYNPKSKRTCCPGQTPHHLVEASAFFGKSRGHGAANYSTGANVPLQGVSDKYDENSAPCVCAEGGSGSGTHGMLHTYQTQQALATPSGSLLNNQGGKLFAMIGSKKKDQFPVVSLIDAERRGTEAFMKTFPEAGCSPNCIKAQLRLYHERHCGMSASTKIKAVPVFQDGKLAGKLAEASRLSKLRSDFVSRAASAVSPC